MKNIKESILSSTNTGKKQAIKSIAKKLQKNLEIVYEKENTDTIRYDIFGNELKCDDIVLILQYDVVNIGYITSFDKDSVENVYCYDAGENREKLFYTKELIKFENYKDLLK
jgi:hypothetical protein